MENLGEKLQLVYRSQADADAIADRGRTTAAAPEHLPSGARGLHGPNVVGGESLHSILAAATISNNITQGPPWGSAIANPSASGRSGSTPAGLAWAARWAARAFGPASAT